MAGMDVLVVGNGGREHELSRQLAASDIISKVFVINGNGGTASLTKTENIGIRPTDTEAIFSFVKQHGISFVIIGPEAPLVEGLADPLRAAGVAVFGPSKKAAQLEGSKAFAADFMQRYSIPQPGSQTACSLDEALAIIKDWSPESYVIKAAGLAGGKGVVLPGTVQEAEEALREMFAGEGFDGAGKEAVVIQERLHGPEVSAFAVTDGTDFIMLPFAQDHKRLQDNDQGPNTGGMGAYAPVPDSIISQDQAAKIREIARQSIDGMALDGAPYQGVLFIGLMLAEERGGDPVVIEYNVRFGDPETEVLLSILSESSLDVADLLLKTAKDDISSIIVPGQYEKATLTVCLAAAGYPAAPRKGDEIFGLNNSYSGVIIHHAGTKLDGDKVVTSGGRVLYVTGFGNTIDEAAANAYGAIGQSGVHFEGMQFRRDIGHQARKPLAENDSVHEKCAVFGSFGASEEAARITFYGLWALQHRGQESSGIVSSDGVLLHRHTGPGLVSNVYREEDLEQLAGSITIGHNRYSTSGAANDAHSQPILKRETKMAFAHNGNLPVTDKLEAFLSNRDIDIAKLNDSGMMAEAINCHMQDGQSLEDAITSAYPLFRGAFSAVAMTADKLVAFRDAHGIRPLSIGRLGNGYVITSETCALDTVGATLIRDIKPGELVVIDKHGLKSHQLAPGKLHIDVFEFIYFARPDSVIAGRSVNEVRENMGKELAREWKIDADIVVPVPDSAIPAALGYSRASGIPFEMALIKNRYIHRTFIRPTAQLREQDLRMKLNPMPQSVRGKRVILIDDSIVRGTTTRKIARMIYDAGAAEVHILISSPPVRYPDFYGINLPRQEDLIAYRMTPDEIRQHLGVDSLGYLSYKGMIKATGLPAGSLSTHCFDGKYPIPIGHNQKHIVQVSHA
ncbi:MAG TPA: amidophosphoribosyltransferase [Candidatus Saccharimonadales bacterium]